MFKELETTKNGEKRYYYLLDILRLLSMAAIISFHTNEFLFYTKTFPLTQKTYVFPIFDIYSRLIPFSGQTIVALSFFLWGLRKKAFNTILKYLLLFLLGHFLVTANFNRPGMLLKNLEWDIYPFLAFSFFVIHFTRKLSSSLKYFLILISSALLFVKPDIIVGQSSFNILNGMLWSTCPSGGSGAWPLFPWLALPIFFYHVGELIGKKIKFFEKIEKKEIIIWTMFLIMGLYGLILVYPGGLYNVHVGAKFYCQMLNLRPFEFWSYFVWIVFFMRLSLLKSINDWGAQHEILRYLRGLYWNSHFGLTYLCHILLLYLGAQFDSFFVDNPVLFDCYFLSLFPMPEFMARFLINIRLRSINK
ncbi:MAG: hypothetical protein K9K67_07265 [Bacteriovoracaceae bacterium]|nr:hypothetical protein [Bacteriovoracaceae bacterium]